MVKIKKGIVVTTSDFTKEYLEPMLESIKDTKYPIIIHTNTNEDNGWEIAGIKKGKETFDEFIHLMDSTFVKDISLFDKLFEMEGNVFLTQGGYHYMGKFVSKTLPELPNVSTKQEAIVYELHWLPKPHRYFEPDLPVHTDNFEEKYGQKRMRLENDYIIKWKGTYFIG